MIAEFLLASCQPVGGATSHTTDSKEGRGVFFKNCHLKVEEGLGESRYSPVKIVTGWPTALTIHSLFSDNQGTRWITASPGSNSMQLILVLSKKKKTSAGWISSTNGESHENLCWHLVSAPKLAFVTIIKLCVPVSISVICFSLSHHAELHRCDAKQNSLHSSFPWNIKGDLCFQLFHERQFTSPELQLFSSRLIDW